MYLSPLRLAGFTEPVVHKKDLQLGRKKLLAELELSGDLTIPVNGQILSKQDIIALFDSLSDEEVLKFHAAVFADDALLRFLENADIKGASWQRLDLYETTEFKTFVSPYFAAAVSRLLQRILDEERPINDFTELFHRPQFLLMQDAEAAFTSATKFYYHRKAAIQALSARMEESANGNYQNIFDPVSMAPKLTYVANEPVLPAEIIVWKEATDIPLLNLLPDEFFGELRYDIANELNNICVIADMQNHSIKTGYEALLAAARIDCGAALHEIIQGNIELFKAKMSQRVIPSRTTAKKESPKFTWSGVGIAIFIIIRLLFAASTCNNSSHSSSYKSTPVHVEPELSKTNSIPYGVLKDSTLFK